MPSHLRIPELTGELPASLSSRAQTDLLRGELGFTGVIVSDGLEMRAVSDRYGIPGAAVQAMIAGTDLLCLGRDQDQASFLAVRAALIEAVRSGRLRGERLEEAAARVAELRTWTAAQRGRLGAARQLGALDAATGAAIDGDGGGPHPIGLAAARRALSADGSLPILDNPLVVQIVPPPNLAVGPVPWGLRPWLADGSYREISTDTPAAELRDLVARLLADGAGRSLVIVVRDAHRYPVAAEAVSQLVTARPDAVVLEMGLPFWRPAAGRYLTSYGAAYSNSRAAAELLGLTAR
jgi:beta-N-acetylhexosaminidase